MAVHNDGYFHIVIVGNNQMCMLAGAVSTQW